MTELVKFLSFFLFACFKMASADQRKETLLKELAKLKLTLRNDSVLCSDYISGNGNLAASEIAHEMAAMHWLHNYSTYPKDVQCIKDYMIRIFGVHKGVWRNAAKCAKMYHLSKMTDCEWPWLAEN